MSDTRAVIVRQDAKPPATPIDADWTDVTSVNRRVAKPTLHGFSLVGLFVVGFAGWAALVPLAGGAIAPGIVSPDGSRRTVQHLEGGIISKIHVRDGDTVTAGQPLMDLAGLQPRATYDMYLAQHRALRATQIRLEAEKRESGTLVFPADFDMTKPDVARLVTDQVQLFRARLTSHEARKKVLARRTEQLAEQIKGFEAQVESTTQQLAYIADEVSGKALLHKKGLMTKPELLRLQRMEAEILGKKGEYIAAIAKAREQISEAEMQSLTLDAERADQIATQLDQVRTELASTEEKLRSSEDILARTVIPAPVSGTVVNLRFKTEGGVVQRGEPILDIVPADDVLLIDARVSPTDIDVVHPGLSAEVHFSSYSGRSTPRVHGRVLTVSADRLVDDHTRQPYYLARVEVDRAHLESAAQNVHLIAGMPADVLIVAAERTMLSYLFQPLVDALWRSFREV